MKKVIGYVNTNDMISMLEDDVRVLDVINIAFGHIKDNVITWNTKDGKEAIQRLKGIHPELKIVLSVGGWSADGFSDAAATEESRAKTAESAVALVKEYGLDGIDIDWEYPCFAVAGIKARKEDKENFTLFLKALREGLDTVGKEKMLTIAVGGDTYYPKHTNMHEAVKYLDYVMLMTYDLQGGFQKVTGHHTSLYMGERNLYDVCADKTVRVFAEAGVPMEKMIIGVAFYSRLWKGVAASEDGMGMEAETTGGYGPDYGTLVKEYINLNGYVRYWDDQAKAPYLFNGSEFISYDDEDSIACKVAYVKEKGMGGVMYWEYRCDGTKTLTQFIRRELDKAE